MRARFWIPTLGLAAFLLYAPTSSSQTGERSAAASPAAMPRLVPVAETKLLMEGMAKPNYDGLTKTLKQKPETAEQWSFARGQALLVAESANLLLIRPPKTKQGQDVWVPKALELREAGVKLAEATSAKDYATARVRLADLANACNRCHAAFQVETRVSPLPPE